MAYDPNDSVESTLAEILAELELSPPSAAPSEPAKAAPEEETPLPAEEPAAPSKPTSQKGAQTALKMPAPAKKAPAPPASEEDEPTTMVFRPMDLKERARLSTVSTAAAAPARPSSRPTASLKEELEQLARSAGNHSLTAQLRAKDGSAAPAAALPAGSARALRRPVKAAPSAGEAASLQTTQVEPAKKRRLTGWKRELFEWGRALVIAFAAVFVVFFVLLRIVSVDGSSMDPTLQQGDRLVISNLFYTPENGDIVVTTAQNGLNKPLVKRIIAVGGQTVDLDESGRILVNGLLLEEDYLDGAVTDPGDQTFPLTVPEGSLFLLGDNREHSTDSRSSVLGMISEDEIEGRVLFRFFPFSRFGSVD